VREAFEKPTLRLLDRTWAPLVLAAFRLSFSRDQRAIPAERMHAQVEAYLEELRSLGEKVPAASGRALCLEWMRGQWLFRNIADNGQEEYSLTSHALEALDLVQSLAHERALISESRINTILDATRRWAMEANPDRQARIDRIEVQIRQLTSERDRLLNGGELATATDDRMVDGYANLVDLIRQLPSDFKRPPATACPATAAMTGLDSTMRVGPIGPSPSGAKRLPPPVERDFKSAPAQNVPPAPHNTATAAESSASNAPNASDNASALARSTALRTSGRSRTTVTTAPSRSTRTASVMPRGYRAASGSTYGDAAVSPRGHERRVCSRHLASSRANRLSSSRSAQRRSRSQPATATVITFASVSRPRPASRPTALAATPIMPASSDPASKGPRHDDRDTRAGSNHVGRSVPVPSMRGAGSLRAPVISL